MNLSRQTCLGGSTRTGGRHSDRDISTHRQPDAVRRLSTPLIQLGNLLIKTINGGVDLPAKRVIGTDGLLGRL